VAKDKDQPNCGGHFWIPRSLEYDPALWGRTTPRPVDKSRPAYCHGMAFIHLLSLAAFKGHTIDNCGQKQFVAPGQVVESRGQLAERFNWSPDTVNRWLNRLKAAGKIKWKTPKRQPHNLLARTAQPPGSEPHKLFQYRKMTITLVKWEQYAAEKVEAEVEPHNLPKSDPRLNRTEEKKEVLEEGRFREEGVPAFITKPDEPPGVRSLSTSCSRPNGPMPTTFDVKPCSTELSDKLANAHNPQSTGSRSYSQSPGRISTLNTRTTHGWFRS